MHSLKQFLVSLIISFIDAINVSFIILLCDAIIVSLIYLFIVVCNICFIISFIDAIIIFFFSHCFIHYFIHWWSSLVLSRKVATKNWFLAHICVATCYSVCVLCTVCTGTWRRTCRLYRPRWRRSGSGGVPGTESTSTTSTGTYRQNPGLRIKIVLWCNKKFK